MAFNAVPPVYTDEEYSLALQTFNDRSVKALVTNIDYWFGIYIFPLINVFSLSVLFDDGGRPAYPVNILVAAEIYKQMHHLSDRELVYKAQTDPSVRFALHLYSYKAGEDVFCRKDLINLRGRCQSWYLLHGQDLLQEIGIEMAQKEAELIHSSGKVRRIDSGFVDSNMSDMSRTQLLYACVSHAAKAVYHLKAELDPSMEHYLDPNDWNAVSCHDKTTPADEKTRQILEDAGTLLEKYKNHSEVSIHPYFLLLKRVFSEQAIIEEDGTVRLKNGKKEGLDSHTLQNPSDPDATFRKKGNEEHKGYICLVVDQDKGPKTIRIYWEFGVNINSDPAFLEQYIMNLPDQSLTDSPDILVGDGLFASEQAKDLAGRKNTVIITTNLSGRKPNLFLLRFQYSEDKQQIVKCPAGFDMDSSAWNEKHQQITAHLAKGHCETCPFRGECPCTEQKKQFAVKISRSSLNRAENWNEQTTSQDYGSLCSYRNGVECNFSNLRRNYRIDELPVRTLIDTRYWYNSCLMAINAKQVCKSMANLARQVVKTI